MFIKIVFLTKYKIFYVLININYTINFIVFSYFIKYFTF